MLRLFYLLALVMITWGNPIDIVVDIEDKRTDQSMGETPKWYNHCKPEPSHHLSKKLSKSQSLTINELFHKIEKSALISLRRAEDVKRKFVDFEHIFDDFEGLSLKSDFKWLPKISPVSEEVFIDMDKEKALKTAHHYIERFAVALEQIVMDQNGRDINDIYSQAIDSILFKDIDLDNYNILCEIRYAMSIVFGPNVNKHFTITTERTIMPEEDRRIHEMSKRMLRDYLILRQYVKTTHFIVKLFEYLRENL